VIKCKLVQKKGKKAQVPVDSFSNILPVSVWYLWSSNDEAVFQQKFVKSSCDQTVYKTLK
jgi:hypothetical protein